jgi:hypothetical protein
MRFFLAILSLTTILLSGCSKDEKPEPVVINPEDHLAQITSPSISSITNSTAIAGAEVTNEGSSSVFSRGFVYHTSSNPSTDNATIVYAGRGKGKFEVILRNLESNTTYYVKAFAKNDFDTAYSDEISFTTPKAVPVLTTNAVTNITKISARSGGNISFSWGEDVTERGVCWSKNPNPTLLDAKQEIAVTTNAFTVDIKELEPDTMYYIRAYATTKNGTGYGNELSFSTLP